MPGNQVHFSWWKLILPFAVAIGFASTFVFGIAFGLLFMLGYLLGAFIDPDADVMSITGSDYRAIRRFGIFGIMWVAYWLPYSYIMPHRSFASHFPGVSTALRLLYILAPMVFGMWWYGYEEYVSIVLYYTGYVWCGLTLSDFVHYVLDKVY